MRTVKRSAVALLVLVVAGLLGPDAVSARLIFDPADPAFNGATVVPLTVSNLGLNNATPILTFSTLQNGVTFGFSTTAAAGMFPAGGGISNAPILNTPRAGVVITISPPVSAIGFNFVLAECVG